MGIRVLLGTSTGNSVADILVQVFVHVCMYLFGVYPGMAWPGCTLGVWAALVDTAKKVCQSSCTTCTPVGSYEFHLPQL